MQSVFSFKKTIICVVFLALFPGLSWAASLQKGETSGLCCVAGSLKASSAKQCEKYKGTYYSAKDKGTAQKECRSQQATPRRTMIPVKAAVPGKAIAPAKTVAIGFCCAKGVIKKSTQSQCARVKGSYYTNFTQAKKSCKAKKIFCCVNGKIGEMSSGECKKRKGTAYTTLAEARKKCKPADIYCCVAGKVSKTSARQCKQRKGKAFVTRSEAERVCRQEKSSGKGASLPGMGVPVQKQPRHAGVQGVDARVAPLPGKKPASVAVASGYCCAGKNVSRQNKKECERRKGVYFSSRIAAEKSCRAQKTAATPAKAKKKGQEGATVVLKPGTGIATGLVVPLVPLVPALSVKGGAGPSVHLSEEGEARLAGRANWSIVSGRVVSDPVVARYPVAGQVYATLIGAPSPVSDERYITAQIENGSYQMSLPPNSHWEVNVLPTMAFHFEELPRGQEVLIPATRREFPKSFTLRFAQEQNGEAIPMCRVNGSVVIDGEAAENFHMVVYEGVTQGFATERRDFPAEENRFVFFVPSGTYQTKPLFRSDSPDFGLVQPKDFSCDPNVRRTVSVHFDINRAQQISSVPGRDPSEVEGRPSPEDALEDVDVSFTVFEGQVVLNGSFQMMGVIKVRLQKVGSNDSQEIVPDLRTGAYRFSVISDGAQYLIKAIVDDNYGYGGQAYVYPTVDGSASTITHNFDIQLPVFQVEPHLINLRTIVQENGSKRYMFDLQTVANPNPSGKKYSREVVVRTNRSGVSHTRTCDFGRNTTCSFALPAVGMSEEDTALEVRVLSRVSFEQEYSVEIPVALMSNSDLVVGKVTLIEEKPSRGSAASGYSTLKDIQLLVKNIGGASSENHCTVSISVNGVQEGLYPFEVLEAGRYRSLLLQMEELGPGDVISAEIAENCDDASGNNRFRHRVQPGEFRFRRN